MDIHGCITGWNSGAERILGYTEADILGRSGEIFFTSEDRAEGKFIVELCRAIEHGRATNERWHLRRDGTRFWASGLMMPLRDADGQPQGFVNILRDRSAVRAEAERRELLMAEMRHRVSNMFTLVQAVATQTLRHITTIADFSEVFHNRLAALARSHDVLIRTHWEDAPLQAVIQAALAAYTADMAEPGRVTIEGINVRYYGATATKRRNLSVISVGWWHTATD
jgi:PAS domain S-box-containing protein